jgi:hypothetical protein
MSAPTPRIRIHKTLAAYPPELPEPRTYLAVRESLNITFYMRRPHREVGPAVARALKAYCRAVGAHKLTRYATCSEYWNDLDTEGWTTLWKELQHPRGAVMTLREFETMTPGYEFVYRGVPLGVPTYMESPEEASFASFWLPTELLDTHGPRWIRELALELGSELPFNSGHAGLAFQFPPDTTMYTEDIRESCFRYPGMDVLFVEEAAAQMANRVKGAHWLTFLGQPVLGALGGAARLRSRLHSPDTTVQDLGADRVVVTLGPQPEAGDKDAERTLAPYRELARILEPWLYRKSHPWPGFTEDDMRRWERRLLD